MASVTVSFQAASRDSVTVSYSASNLNTPNPVTIGDSTWHETGDSRSMSYLRETYNSPTFTWTVDGVTAPGNGSSGSYESKGKTSGVKVTIQVSVKIRWSGWHSYYSAQQYKDSNGQWHDSWAPVSEEYSIEANDSGSGSLVAWTKAAEFSWSINVSSDQLIELTAADWNKLIETVQKNVNWQKQQDANPSIATVNPNDWITAKAYNDIATQAGISQVQADQLITAELINALSNGVNGMERG